MEESHNTFKLTKTYDRKIKNPVLTVVMLHGIASDSHTFDKTIAYLEKDEKLSNVRLVTFDLLGSGKSPKDDNTMSYGYRDQLGALHRSIEDLKANSKIVLVGHSMGTLIATRYASKHKDIVKQLILVSPPIYTEADMANPLFSKGMKVFEEAISIKDPGILREKSFRNVMDKIILDKKNSEVLASIDTPTVLIYGAADQFIASYNIPRLLAGNPEYLTAIKTNRGHGVSQDKYVEIDKILRKLVDA